MADLKTEAEATISQAILDGIAQNGDIVKVRMGKEDEAVRAIREALFHPSVRWAVKAYLTQLEGGEQGD